jgi:hypothetical protein
MNKMGYRRYLAVCKEDCHMYTCRTGELLETLDKYPHYKTQMYRIADEKEKYHTLLETELKEKY